MYRRIITIAALAGTSLIASATVASANVGYDANGVGHVDKGDVQTAFGWNNPAFDATVKTGNEAQFSAGFTKVYDNMWSCTDGTEVHSARTITGSRPVAATPTMSSNNKQVSGWNLTGLTGAATSVTTVDERPALSCPEGSSFDPSKPIRFNQDKFSTFTVGDLKVTIGGVTKDLPITPAPAV